MAGGTATRSPETGRQRLAWCLSAFPHPVTNVSSRSGFAASAGNRTVPQEFSSSQGEWTMEQPGLDNRHRDKNGQIARKHGNTLISTLRRTYGPSFGQGYPDDAQLIDILHQLDEPSLSKLVHDVHGER
jgi:hypothetical protein